MFETDPMIGLSRLNSMNRFTADQNARQSNINLQRLEEWRDYARELEVKVANLRKEVEDFRLQAIVNLASKEGFRTTYQAMKQAHPTSPLLSDTGRRFKDGDIKTKATLMYEEVFDRIIRDHKIADPETYRQN